MSAIWHRPLDIEAMNAPGPHIKTLLDIRIEEAGDDWISASMPVDQRTHQPYGILHGGASVVLAESVGSMASYACIDTSTHYCVGLDVNANHLRAVRTGRVTARATAVHLGRTTHVWDIRLRDDQGKTTCIARLTMAIVPLKAD